MERLHNENGSTTARIYTDLKSDLVVWMRIYANHTMQIQFEV